MRNTHPGRVLGQEDRAREERYGGISAGAKGAEIG